MAAQQLQRFERDVVAGELLRIVGQRLSHGGHDDPEHQAIERMSGRGGRDYRTGETEQHKLKTEVDAAQYGRDQKRGMNRAGDVGQPADQVRGAGGFHRVPAVSSGRRTPSRSWWAESATARSEWR